MLNLYRRLCPVGDKFKVTGHLAYWRDLSPASLRASLTLRARSKSYPTLRLEGIQSPLAKTNSAQRAVGAGRPVGLSKPLALTFTNV